MKTIQTMGLFWLTGNLRVFMLWHSYSSKYFSGYSAYQFKNCFDHIFT